MSELNELNELNEKWIEDFKADFNNLCEKYVERIKPMVFEYIEKYKSVLFEFYKFVKDEDIDVKKRESKRRDIVELKIEKANENLILFLKSAIAYNDYDTSGLFEKAMKPIINFARMTSSITTAITGALASRMQGEESKAFSTITETLTNTSNSVLGIPSNDENEDKNDTKELNIDDLKESQDELYNLIQELAAYNKNIVNYLQHFDPNMQDKIEIFDMYFDTKCNGLFRFHVAESYNDEIHIPTVIYNILKKIEGFDGLYIVVRMNEFIEKIKQIT
jgi:hypothetical protein